MICNLAGLKKRSSYKIKMAFPNGLRADILETEDLDLLKKAGAYYGYLRY